MATTVYSVAHAEGVFYVPTQAQAVKIGREAREAGDLFVNVQRCVVTDSLPRRELFCALLNGESWAQEQEEVEV
jgi:hypothetical protein